MASRVYWLLFAQSKKKTTRLMKLAGINDTISIINC